MALLRETKLHDIYKKSAGKQGVLCKNVDFAQIPSLPKHTEKHRCSGKLYKVILFFRSEYDWVILLKISSERVRRTFSIADLQW